MPRMTDWIDTRIGLSIVGNGQLNSRVDGMSTQVVQRGTTVIRTIIALDLLSETVAGVWGVQLADLAIGIVSREAYTAGILPDPDTNTDKPARGWMWRGSRAVTQNGSGGQFSIHLSADIRGARKVEDGVVFLMVANTNYLGTAFNLRVVGLIRMLVKLP